MRRLCAWAVVLSGALTLLIAIVMGMQGAMSSIPPQIVQKTMLRFELTRSTAEVYALLGPSLGERGHALRMVLDAINKTDFVFMAAYSALNVALLHFVVYAATPSSADKAVLRMSFALGAATLTGDALENTALMQLTHDISDFSVRFLYVATRVRWCALFIAVGMIGVIVRRTELWGRRLISPVGTAGMLLGLFAVLAPNIGTFDPRVIAERQPLLLAVVWLTVTINAALSLAPRKAK